VLARSGLPMKSAIEDGVVHAALDLTESDRGCRS
jgi:hypothetical protein